MSRLSQPEQGETQIVAAISTIWREKEDRGKAGPPTDHLWTGVVPGGPSHPFDAFSQVEMHAKICFEIPWWDKQKIFYQATHVPVRLTSIWAMAMQDFSEKVKLFENLENNLHLYLVQWQHLLNAIACFVKLTLASTFWLCAGGAGVRPLSDHGWTTIRWCSNFSDR